LKYYERLRLVNYDSGDSLNSSVGSSRYSGLFAALAGSGDKVPTIVAALAVVKTDDTA